ncbi:hypothetical protein FE257_008786 [Aspergillus nanangensis]|uniref:Major facilitator superfamily (MFS) profile domain-containing protein n=1 Tax=Aspergillus nanangensis TaxID=2582783 RepID=A0AAD4CLC5_ASPNN|nr:hypothetical protein FE257_008786 [Aspergillus nanangensis]
MSSACREYELVTTTEAQINPQHDAEKSASTSNRSAIFIAYLGAIVAGSEDSLMAATYATIASDFQELSMAPLLITAYNLGYCIALPIYGTLADLFGRKSSLLLGYTLFGLGCMICTMGTSMTHLITGRVLSGIGSAGMVVMISIMIVDLAPPSEVALLRSYTNVCDLIGRSLGAPFGSLVTSKFGWRWAFGGRIPIIVGCFILARAYMPASQSQEETRHSSSTDKLRKIDFLGSATFVATIIPLTLAFVAIGDLNEESSGRGTYGLLFLASAISCIAFVFVEKAWATRPLVPLDLLWQGIGQYWLIQVLIFIGRLTITTTVVQYLIQVKHMADEIASTFLIVSSVGLSIGSVTAGYTIKKTKRYKRASIIAITGAIFCSLLLFASWSEPGTVWGCFLLIPIGTATGFTLSGEFIGVSSRSPPQHLASVIGAYYLSQQLGMIIGSSLGPALVRKGFMHEMLVLFPDRIKRDEIMRGVLRDSRFAFSLPGEIQAVVRRCLAYGYQFVPLTLMTSLGLILPILVVKREERLE